MLAIGGKVLFYACVFTEMFILRCKRIAFLWFVVKKRGVNVMVVTKFNLINSMWRGSPAFPEFPLLRTRMSMVQAVSFVETLRPAMSSNEHQSHCRLLLEQIQTIFLMIYDVRITSGHTTTLYDILTVVIRYFHRTISIFQLICSFTLYTAPP